MTQSVNVILNAPLNPNLGPTFSIAADVGAVTPSIATSTQLLAGIPVTVDTTATQIFVTPVFGNCKTPITLPII